MSLLLVPLLPLAAAGAVLLLRSRPRAGAVVAVGGLALTALAGVWAAAIEPALTFAWSPAFDLVLRVDGFGRVMVVLVPFVAAPIVAYAARSEPQDRTRLLVLMLGFAAAMLVLVMAADFVTLLIAWELVGAASWALIGHGWRDRGNVEAATQSFITTRLGDLGLYVAVGATFAATGSFAFDGLPGAAGPWPQIVAAGILVAAAAKSAQVPFSPWLFAAMAGPTPVSALLHSATLVAAGAYLLIRLSPSLVAVTWFLPAVAIVGMATALAGGVVALVQRHAKRVLAASTSAQYGLMFVAVGAGSTAAAGAQLVTHAVFKSLLFLGAGIAIHATGTATLGERRLGRALPLVAAASGIGALALAGVPPLGGAWSKEAILAAAAGASPVLGAGVLAAGLLTALYAGRYQLLAFGRGEGQRGLRRPTAAEIGAVGLLALATALLSGLWLPGAPALAEGLTGGSLAEGAPWGLLAALTAAIGGALVVVALDRRGRLMTLGGAAPADGLVGEWLGLDALAGALVVRPVLRFSALLARLDDRVIDAGVRAAARIAALVSALVTRRVEISVDAVVHAGGSMALATADLSRRSDDQVVDAAVEGSGRAVGIAGHQSRRLQTGLSHHYFVIVGAGLVAIAGLLAVYR